LVKAASATATAAVLSALLGYATNHVSLMNQAGKRVIDL
jgi:hypothetical protein